MSKRFGSDFYDEKYFMKTSEYGLYGGYQSEIQMNLKAMIAGNIMSFAGYTKRFKPNNCLVLGCAVGYMVHAFEIGADIPSLGIDISDYAITRGKKEGIKNTHVGDFCDLSTISDREYELVISLDNLEHIPEDDGQLDKVIDEHIRVCDYMLVVSILNGKIPERVKDKSLFTIRELKWWVEKFESRGLKLYRSIPDPENERSMIIFER